MVSCLPTLLSGASCGLWNFKSHLICEMHDSPDRLLQVCVKFLYSSCTRLQGQDIYFSSRLIVCGQDIGITFSLYEAI